ncbi:capsid protein [Erinnyis ello granulovirus]|uniref:Capsid protein n=1 Tax=Erinnyis ello granulovirus TaxID=307444 RepID=A0A097DAU5_9BBAC|nr:capsid protein [Erinnyis ello granulovirus]AIS92124.1 capsid protein [Erinnyis ello granulovirus]ARX71465.1 capsid protein [Erinnyis ello granulovirus]ARX71595.1 capsid protein [Erinnyis ello granulovirus]ARX71725.1 capsid protein [Erinnyis ello granulovirus]ARX71855.1 capsid protein [Erinnyis ello granulovirus]
MNCVDTVTARSNVVYQPIKLSQKKQCQSHWNRTNCTLTQTKGQNSTVVYHHYTVLDSKYCSSNGDPYYEWLLNNDVYYTRKQLRFNNAYTTVCGVEYTAEQDECVRNIESAGETDMQLVRSVIRYVYNYLENDKMSLNGHAKTFVDSYEDNESKVYVLFCEMFIQCLYSHRQCIILPQEMYCLYKEGEEPILNECYFFNTIPETDYSIVSQDIYKSFIVYNTTLTMILQEPNPFNDNTKAISKIIESVGTCTGGEEGGKKKYIQICKLKFGGNVSGHVMCPPKEMVKMIYRYAKWRMNPKNYARYFELLVNDKPKHEDSLREWDVFLKNFKSYFFP